MKMIPSTFPHRTAAMEPGGLADLIDHGIIDQFCVLIAILIISVTSLASEVPK